MTPYSLFQAIATRIEGIQIITVGVGTNLDRLELSAIASDPADINTITVSSFTNLNSIADNIILSFCDGTQFSCLLQMFA